MNKKNQGRKFGDLDNDELEDFTDDDDDDSEEEEFIDYESFDFDIDFDKMPLPMTPEEAKGLPRHDPVIPPYPYPEKSAKAAPTEGGVFARKIN